MYCLNNRFNFLCIVFIFVFSRVCGPSLPLIQSSMVCLWVGLHVSILNVDGKKCAFYYPVVVPGPIK